MSEIVLESVTKRFGHVQAVDGVSFRAEKGKFVVLLFQRQFMQSFMQAGIK